MKKFLMAVCSVLLTVLLCACGSDALSVGVSLCADIRQDSSATYGYEPMTSSAPTSYNEYKSAAVNFSLNTLSALYDGSSPVFFSPSALFSSLSLLENAATGSTQIQIKKAVNPETGLSGLNESSGYFFSRLGSIADGDCKISVNGSIFFNEGNAVSSEFLKTNVNYYNQAVFRLDFAEEDSLKKVNDFIGEQSLGNCRGLFKKLEKDVNLASSALMSDEWISAFELKDGNLTGVEYLLEGKNCKGFIKDFKNTSARFVALLPDKDLGSFLNALDAEKLAKIIGSMNVFRTADIIIKPIKAETAADFSDILRSMGIDEAFSQGKFGGVSFGKKAAVGAIGQYASLSIDQNGANSDRTVKPENQKAEAETALTFDRPYIYMIIDNESGIPVFMGIENP